LISIPDRAPIGAHVHPNESGAELLLLRVMAASPAEARSSWVTGLLGKGAQGEGEQTPQCQAWQVGDQQDLQWLEWQEPKPHWHHRRDSQRLCLSSERQGLHDGWPKNFWPQEGSFCTYGCSAIILL